MEQVRKRLSCVEANKMDLVDYLATIGHEPKSIRGNDYWYISPFREEHNASFKVNRSGNVWFDHGEGKGGNLVDFGLQYYRCSVSELLAKLDGNRGLLNAAPKKAFQKPQDDASHIVITDERPLSNLALLQYSQSRGIPDYITHAYCKEVSYTNEDCVNFFQTTTYSCLVCHPLCALSLTILLRLAFSSFNLKTWVNVPLLPLSRLKVGSSIINLS